MCPTVDAAATAMPPSLRARYGRGMRFIVAALPLALVTVLAAGCGSNDETTSYTTQSPPSTAQTTGEEESTPTPEPTETATETPEPTPSPTEEPTTAPADGGGGKGEEIEIVGTEFAFDPTEVTAKAGTVTLTLDNQGQAPHEIVVLDTDTAPDALETGDDGTVPEDDAVGEVEEIPGGEKAFMTIEFKPGSTR